jgi:hypothetical protein
VNVINWFGRVSLFTFPRHTRKDLAPRRIGIVHDRPEPVMYITDNAPADGAQWANQQGSARFVSLLSRMKPVTGGRAGAVAVREVDPGI